MASRVPSRSGIPRNVSSSSHITTAAAAAATSSSSQQQQQQQSSSSLTGLNGNASSHRTAQITSSTGALRRNVFPRRPTAQTGASSSSASSLHVNGPMRASSSSRDKHLDKDNSSSSNDEIIIRDPITGSFALDSPTLPMLPPRPQDEDGEEAEACRRVIDIWRKNGSLLPIAAMAVGGSVSGTADAAVAVVDESEIRAVLLARMEANYRTLDEDGWMFGDEEKDEE